MGHREDLLEGAKRCLLEKGYAGTTARDIVAASGANLASIGYHYGSKDALMRQAIIASSEEWGTGVAQVPAGGEAVPADAEPLERFAAVWDLFLQRIATEREFIAAQVEVLGLLPRDAALREAIGEVLPEGGEGLVAIFEGVPDTEVDAEAARVVGPFYQALLTGLMVQSLLTPDRMPTGRDLAAALRRVTAGEVLGKAE
ncbi:TetR/AcrR family transcriptional regulator [Streptomyces platensis]|uniref:HTH-type transcriptional repressor AcnR n=1 Tax=Streptomyces platensis TaxID=58346 RepID=A0AAE6TPF6_STRPT|nr:TetR/AcrR family transcriptional regulator [Streptomyces platensis]OSY45154.1 HTH-type transcriptional repressor AcnR [Streptomyces platensis]QEV54872.1 TetR/AcrR family transcriptional regulator [Streptomyces platensis]BCK68360.1 TetR family transcriptional regulator [Streptomyces libani subsp. rufus]